MAALVSGGTIAAGRLFRVRARSAPPTRDLIYECGEEPEGLAQVRFHPRYYVVALVFVLFDTEAAFLLPWALDVRTDRAVAVMFLFVGVLLLGWVYAVRKGALKWQ